MTKTTDKVGIFAKVRGNYFKPYKSRPVEFEIDLQFHNDPDLEIPSNHIMGLTRRLTQNYLSSNRKKFDEYHELREIYTPIELEHVFPDGKEKPKQKEVERMTKSELDRYCILKGYNLDIKDYTTVGDARQAVLDEEENLKIAKHEEEKRDEGDEVKAVDRDRDISDFLKFNKIQ